MSIQDIQTALAAVGSLGGLGALIATFFGRRKLRAEAADVITDTALTLVEPLQKRVKEVTQEAIEARAEVTRTRTELGQAADELAEVRMAFAEVVATMKRWRTRILNPSVSREELCDMVRTDPATEPATGSSMN